MLIHQLRMRIAPQQDREIIKPSNNSLEFNSIDEKYSDRSFVLSDVVQEHVLNVLAFLRHVWLALSLAVLGA